MKFFSFFCAILFANNILLKAQNNTSDSFYSIDYVFTGTVEAGMDSVFSLCYKFTKAEYKRFGKFILTENSREKQLDLKAIVPDGNYEIKQDDRYVYIIIKQYDKENIPLIVQGEDKKGRRYNMNVSYANGIKVTPAQFKRTEESNRTRIRQDRVERN